MTLKGNVIRVLIFLIALIFSAGATIGGGLRFGQDYLVVIAGDAADLENTEVPLLIATRNVQMEAFHLAMGHKQDDGKLVEALDKVGKLLHDDKTSESGRLIGEIERELQNPSPALANAANRLVAVTEKRSLEHVAELSAGTDWLSKVNDVLSWLVLGFTGGGVLIGLWCAVTPAIIKVYGRMSKWLLPQRLV